MTYAYLTKEELRNVMGAILEHPESEDIIDNLETVIAEELELKGKRLINAIIDDDVDGVIEAFTGWDIQVLLEKAKIIPHISGVLFSDEYENNDNVVFPDIPIQKE